MRCDSATVIVPGGRQQGPVSVEEWGWGEPFPRQLYHLRSHGVVARRIMLSVRSCFILSGALVALVIPAVRSDLLDDYKTCKAHGFANSTFVCDVDDLLSNKTTSRLEKVLFDIQTTIECQCDDRELCYRNPGNGISTAYMVVLIATTSAKTENENLNETAHTIYYDAKLGRNGCDNGMLVIYIKDKNQIATYRGPLTYGFLTDDEINDLKRKSNKTDADHRLEYLFRGYQVELNQTPSYQLSSYAPVVGMAVAAVLILVALALLLGLLCSCLCVCCCCRRRKEDKNLTETGSYRKTIEPVYIVTEPSELTTVPEIIYAAPFATRSSTPSRGPMLEKVDPPFLDPLRPTEVQTRTEFLSRED